MKLFVQVAFVALYVFCILVLDCSLYTFKCKLTEPSVIWLIVCDIGKMLKLSYKSQRISALKIRVKNLSFPQCDAIIRI